MEIDFTVVLTTAAVKFLIADQLPKVPYFTFIDTYIMIAVFFLFAKLVLNVISSECVKIMSPDDALWVDSQLRYCWIVTYAIVHIGILLYVAWKLRKNNQNFPVIASPGQVVEQTDIAGGVCYECAEAIEDVADLWGERNDAVRAKSS